MATSTFKGYPLSMQQARTWILQGGEHLQYARCSVRLQGSLDLPAFQYALHTLIQRHEILRTAFRRLSGMEIPVQVVAHSLEVSCPLIDLEQLATTDQHWALNATMQHLHCAITDVETLPLIALALVRLAPETHTLQLCLPTLCADDYTLMRMMEELNWLYMAICDKQEQDEEPLQYTEVADWQEQLWQSEEAEPLRAYWHKGNSSQRPTPRLPFASSNSQALPDLQAGEEARVALPAYDVVLEEDLTALIMLCSEHARISVEAWFLACWQILLWRLNGMTDTQTGLACNGRYYEGLTGDLATALGPLTRLVPFEVHLEYNQTFQQAAISVNNLLKEAIKRQHYFSSTDARADNTSTTTPPQPFFPLGFSYVEWPVAATASNLHFSLDDSSCTTDASLLTLRAVRHGNRIHLSFYSYSAYYRRDTLERLARTFQTLLQSCITRFQAPLSTLILLEAEQQASLLARGRGPERPVPHVGFQHLFEAQVQRYPAQMAALSAHEQLTYQQLNIRANRLAHALRRRGAGPGVLVGLCLARRASMLVGMLGILKAGGAYLPLDAGNPSTRLSSHLCKSEASLLLTQEALHLQLSDWNGTTLYLEELEKELVDGADENPVVDCTGEDLAYVIYTSGSTGQPKGVMIAQRGVVNYTQALCEQIKAQPGWQYATVSTLAADLGNTAIFCALTSGGCVHVLDNEQVTSGEALAYWAQQHPIDVLKIVPSHLSALLESTQAQTFLPRQALLLGGETLQWPLLEYLRQISSCQVYNHYGPTETTIGVLVNSLINSESGQSTSVPLGYPIANAEVYVLDWQFQLLPAGATGELYIGGAGIAHGYLQQPEQTADRFVPNPYSEQPGARLYRSGDLGYIGEDGKLVFVGRSDGQVKLRGYRIELGEVEAALRRHPLIWDCMVIGHAGETGVDQLIGYVAARTMTGLTPQAIRESLRASLPEYMVPSQIVVLDHLPLTPNGKMDRRQLPAPDFSQQRDTPDLRRPQSPIEEMIVPLWTELLHIPTIGTEDNFFALGGHSLLATRVIARVQALFSVTLPVQSLFEAPTVASFAQRVEQALHQDESEQQPPLVAGPRPAEIPLSFAQQRLWFLDQLEPGSAAYLVPRALRFSGNLSTEALEKSLEKIIHRHEGLRTTFEVHAGQPVQIIHPPHRFILPVIDLQGLSPGRREQEARRLVRQESLQPCDLAKGPLLRTALLRQERQAHVILLTLHHIVTDAWSSEILVRELTMLYRAFLTGQPLSLAPLPLQYADYAIWQRGWLQGAVLETQMAYWRRQLAGTAPLALPTDHPRPVIQTSHGATQTWLLSQQLSQGLQALSQQEHVTLFMTLLASFQVLLMRYSGQSDISIGTPVANRRNAEIDGVIGFFVNTLVLRSDLSGNPSFVEMLQRVHEVCLGAYAHQDVPFEQVVEALDPERDLSRSPLFQVLFSLQNVSQVQGDLMGIGIDPLDMEQEASKFDFSPRNVSQAQEDLMNMRLNPLDVEQSVSKFDLSLVVGGDAQEGLYVTLEYNTDLFEGETMQRLLSHWQTLLEGVLRNPHTSIAEIPLLTDTEHDQLARAWTTSSDDDPLESDGIHHLFEQQVTCTPEAIAVTFEDQQLTYDALNRRANQLAHHLRKRGVGPEVPVGLCLPRTLEMMIALLGVLKAGGAYVPLDPGHPAERLTFMMEDAHIELLLTHQPASEDRATPQDVSVLDLRRDWAHIVRECADNPPATITAANLAYVIYTSGSTGRPKGVMVSHGNVMRLMAVAQPLLGFDATDIWSMFHTYAFDFSVWEMWGALLYGARLVLVPYWLSRSPIDFHQFAREQAVTVLNQTPSAFRQFIQVDETTATHEDLGLRRVIFGGEKLEMESLRPWVERHGERGPQLINMYGITETTVHVTSHPLTQAGALARSKSIIGKPFADLHLYILDAFHNLVPIGVPGELYVGGRGVARGYLHRPDLTAERFVPHPWSSEPGARLYRTGDLVRNLPDGTMEYLERVDQQVKIRGYRIELGEIEAVLRQHPEIRECVVLAREDKPTGKRLVAYLVEQPQAGLTHSSVRSWLRERLPGYMLPAAFVFLNALPLTAHGKIDLRALPAPEKTRPELPEAFVAPGSDVETLLATIWSQVLGVGQVGIHDNFFALGGDSILSIQVVARARAAGLHFTPRQLFQHQSIAQLASVVTTDSTSQAQQGLVTGPVPLMPIQRWFFARQLPEPYHFNQAVLLESSQSLRLSWLQQALWQIILHHDALRLRFTRQIDGDWQQELAAPIATYPYFLCIDLSALPREWQEATITDLASLAQTSLELSAGLLLRTLYFHCSDHPDYLLLLIHHLAVDGVSWRVLLEDLQTAYDQLARDEHIHLPDKTTSWQAWAQFLQQTAQTEELRAESSYWLAPARQQVKPLPLDLPEVIADGDTVSVSLSAELTHALLQVVPAVYHTQVNDVLLTALAQAFSDWTGQSRMLVDLEGHGREEFAEGLDLSRTVGWFTTIFPVLLDLEHATTPSAALKAVKEQLRQVPQKGLGYGLLRHLAEQPIAEQLASLPRAQVAFNYLGQFDTSFSEQVMFQPARISAGALHSPREPRSHLLTVNGMVANKQLYMTWQYNRSMHHAETIQQLAQRFITALTTLITHCQSPDAGGYTPSDFPLADLDQQQLDALILRLSQQQTGRPGENIEDIYPLSPMQAGLLFHSLYMPAAGVYSVQMGWTIEGALHLDAWQKTWRYIIARHPILRTLFAWEGLPRSMQVVYKHVELPWELYDWRGLTTQELQQRHEALRRQAELTSSALGSAPLLRLVLARTGEQACYFHLSMHHLITDGWSQSLLLGEVEACYQIYSAGREPDLGPVRPYRDYIAWLQRQNSTHAENFWRAYLRGFDTPNQLPGHMDASVTSGLHVNVQRLECSAGLTASLQARTQQLQVTLNTLIQGAWGLLLSRYSGKQDVVFGATTTGRTLELSGIEAMVGVFINSLPVRAQVHPESELSTWLRTLQSEQAEARQFEHTPLVQIQQWSDLPSGQMLFETLLVFQNYPLAATVLEAVDTLAIQRVATVEQTHYPLMLKVVPGQGWLQLSLQYDEARFEAAFVARMLQHLQALLQAIAVQPEQRLGDLTLLSEQERQQLLVAWNATEAAVPRQQGVHQLFEQQVQRTPEAIALVCEERHLTYAGLDRRANQLAHYLRGLGVGPEVMVGICLEPSVSMAIGVLGILKAGGTVVPLDPGYPAERIAFLASDAQISVLLTEQHIYASLPALPGTLVLLDRDWSRIEQQPHNQPGGEIDVEQLVYVIYTSGSTGMPKGVALPHRALINLLGWHHTQLIGQARTLQFASLSFDASFHEMFAAWNAGGTLCIVPESLRRDVVGLADFLSLLAVEKMILPVVMLQQLASQWNRQPDHSRTMREITATGEQLQISRPIAAFFAEQPHVRLHNHYGPSESHVVTSYTLTGPAQHWPTHPSIGRPIANTQIYILDASGQPVPIGMVGEVYIGGMNLARGYLERPDLTAERFLPHPFSQQEGARLYKTGDLARYQEDGTIEYLGRVDHQVKIRGYRVELGEIESLLNQHPEVKEGIVLACEDATGTRQLVAYLVLKQDQVVKSSDLREYLRAQLPEYMLPSFVMLEALPLTSNGKVDRRALPEPELTRLDLSVAFVAARTPAEEVIAAIWAEELNVHQVGMYDNFFELGGHSLRAIRLISQLRDAFQVELPLRTLFERPTVDELVDEIASLRGGRDIIEEIAQVLQEIEELSEEDMKIILDSEIETV